MKSARLCAALFLLILLGPRRIRTEEPADCTGQVSDETGVPVAAAHVTLEDAAGRVYRTETDATGRFAIRNLAPGEYKLEARKEGFFVLAGRTLLLHTGGNDVALVLNHEEELHERVQVSARSNAIDTQDTAQRLSLTERDIRDIPVPNSHLLRQSLIALPETVQDNSGNLHVAGARSSDTQYLLDGFEIGDPGTGLLNVRFNVDATRAAEAQAGRVGANYAHSGASILSLETPDGDDRWRAGTTNPLPDVNFQQGAHLGNWYPRFTFSGPVERGRFWFSDSASVQHTYQVIKELPPGANTAEEWAGDNLLRLQYNLTPKQILHASILYNRSHAENLGLNALVPQLQTVTTEQRRGFASLKDQIVFGNTLVDLGIAGDDGTSEYIPQGAPPYAPGAYFQHLHDRAGRLQAAGSVTTILRRGPGTHQLAAGFNTAGLRLAQSAERGVIQAFRADGTLARESTFSGPGVLRLSNRQAGFYLQDTWTISKRFLVKPGLRIDWDRFTHSAMAGPRLTGNYLPFGDDRARVSLGWGIYNAPLNLALLAQAYDQQQEDLFYDAAGTVVVLGPIASRFALPAGGLQQPRFAIVSGGWQQKLGRNTMASLELLARNGSHGFAYADQQPALPGGVFLLEDRRKDRYRSATFSVRHVFSRSTELSGAFTRSHASSNMVLNPALGSLLYATQQSAPVAWDAPNRLLAWGWMPTHIWSTQISGFFEYRTGYPYSLYSAQQLQIVGLPNSQRFPSYISLNLGLEKKFALKGSLWAARVQAVNILGRQNPEFVVNNVDAPACSIQVTQACFGAFSGGQKRAFTMRLRFVGRK